MFRNEYFPLLFESHRSSELQGFVFRYKIAVLGFPEQCHLMLQKRLKHI